MNVKVSTNSIHVCHVKLLVYQRWKWHDLGICCTRTFRVTFQTHPLMQCGKILAVRLLVCFFMNLQIDVLASCGSHFTRYDRVSSFCLPHSGDSCTQNWHGHATLHVLFSPGELVHPVNRSLRSTVHTRYFAGALLLLLRISLGVDVASAQGSWDPNTLVYDGSGLGLMEVPDDIPAEAVSITLSHNRIQNITNGTFSKHENCTELYLNSNEISLVEDEAFVGLRSLVYLTLSSNSVPELQASLFDDLTEVKQISLQGNSISSISPGVFTPMANIERIDLRWNPVSVIQTNTFVGLSSVYSMDLMYGKTHVIQSHAFLGLSLITELSLWEHELYQLDPGAFNGLSSLEALPMHWNNLTKLSGDMFTGLDSLTSLTLYHNKLTTLEPNTFLPLHSLKTLDLGLNVIEEISPLAFEGLRSLESLELMVNKITTLKSGTFHSCTSLTRLSLYQNPIKIIETSGLSGPNSLTYLNINGNELVGFGPTFFEPTGLSEQLALDALSEERFSCEPCLCWLTNKTTRGEITDLDGGSNIDKIYNVPYGCDYLSLDECGGVDYDLVCPASGSRVTASPSALLEISVILMICLLVDNWYELLSNTVLKTDRHSLSFGLFLCVIICLSAGCLLVAASRCFCPILPLLFTLEHASA